jgi:FkbM family methyltransferase
VLREGDVFFDVGANVGFYTFLAAAHVGRCGSVHAFEANAALLPHLLRSIRLNPFPDRITLTHAVVGRKEEQKQLFYLPADPDLIGASSAHLHPWLGAGVRTEVPAVTLDRYVQDKRLAQVDVVKIDIEGGEFAAFQGMQETFTRTPPLLIVCELMPAVVRLGDGKPQQRAPSAASPAEIADFLQMHGYQPWHIRTRDGTLDYLVGRTELENLSDATMNVAFVAPSLRRSRLEVFPMDGR